MANKYDEYLKYKQERESGNTDSFSTSNRKTVSGYDEYLKYKQQREAQTAQPTYKAPEKTETTKVETKTPERSNVVTRTPGSGGRGTDNIQYETPERQTSEPERNTFGTRVKGFLGRVGNMISGAEKQVGASYGETFATAYDGTSVGDVYNENTQAIQKRLEIAQQSLNDPSLTDDERADTEWTINMLQEELRKSSDAARAVQETPKMAHQVVNELNQSGARDIEAAQEGLGGFGKFLVEAGSSTIQSGTDMLTAAAMGIPTSMIPFAARAFGGSAIESRELGYDNSEVLIRSTIGAAKEVFTEKLFGMTTLGRAAYGKGSLDDITEKAISMAAEKLANTPGMKDALEYVLGKGAGMVSEGAEEFIGDWMEYAIAKMSPELYKENSDTIAETLSQSLYDFAVGAASGFMGDTANVINTVQTASLGRSVNKTGTSDLMEAAKNSSEGSDARMYAERYGNLDKLSNLQAGRLAQAYGQELMDTDSTDRRLAYIREQVKNNDLTNVDEILNDERALDVLTKEAGLNLDSSMTKNQAIASVANALNSTTDETGFVKRDAKLAAEEQSLTKYQSERKILNALQNARVNGEITNSEIDAIVNDANALNLVKDMGVEVGNASNPAELRQAVKTTIEGLASPNTSRFETSGTNTQSNIKSSKTGVFSNIEEETKNIDNLSNYYYNDGKQAVKSAYRNYVATISNPMSAGKFNEIFSHYYQQGNTGKNFVMTAGLGFTREMAKAAYESGFKDMPQETIAKGKVGARPGFRLKENEANVPGKMAMSTVRALDNLGKSMGVEIRFADRVAGGMANGSYQDGVILIAKDSDNPVIDVIKHEVTHRLQDLAPKEYQAYKDYVLNTLESRGVLEKKIQDWGALYKTTNRGIITDEIVSDFTETMFKDVSEFKSLVSSKKNIAAKLHDTLKSVISKIKSGTYGATEKAALSEVEQAERLWAEALKAAEKNVKNVKGESGKQTQYSFKGYNERGEGIYEGNFPKGTPKAAKTQRILELIQNVWSKKPISLVIEYADGSSRTIQAQFDPTYEVGKQSDASKLAAGNRHGNSTEKRVTLDLADDLYQIASESWFNYSKPEEGKTSVTHIDVNEWHYFVNDIQYAEYGEKELTPYKVGIDVKEKNDGTFVYSFHAERQNKKADTLQTLHAAVSNSDNEITNVKPSNGKISQQDAESKGYSKDSSYSLKDRSNMTHEELVNSAMTMDEAERMIQSAWGLVRDWYDDYSDPDNPRNAQDWLKLVGADEVGMTIENDYTLQQKYINRNESFDVEDDYIDISEVVQAYIDGTLVGKEKKKSSRLDTSKSLGVTDNRFYAPSNPEVTADTWTLAKSRVTKSNKAEVMKARRDILFAAHYSELADIFGISKSELNKQLRTWSNYSAYAMDVSKRINSGVALENQWTGIQNCSFLSKTNVTDENILDMVKEVKGDSTEYERNYIARTMLALDTHIDWKDATFEFVRGRVDQNRSSVRGTYNDESRTVRVGANGSLNTVAHEMGHYLDAKWFRDLLGVTTAKHSWITQSLNRDMIKTEEGKQFYDNFQIFMDSLTDSNDIRNEYTNDRKEVFARFVARFVEWTDKTAGGYVFNEFNSYNDNFTAAQFVEFAKLLQEKAMFDSQMAAANNEAKFSLKQEIGTARYSKKWNESDENQVTIDELFASMPEVKDSYQALFNAFDDIKAAGSDWNIKGVQEVFEKYPELDFLDRFANPDEANVDVRTDLEDFLYSMPEEYYDPMIIYPVLTKNKTWQKYRKTTIENYEWVIERELLRIKKMQDDPGQRLGVKPGNITLKETREWFDKLNSDSDIGALADKVFKFVEDHPEFASDISFDPKKMKTGGEQWGAKVRYNTEYFNNPKYSNQHKAATILHELIHSCTSYAIFYSQFGPGYLGISQEMYDACQTLESIARGIKSDRTFLYQGIKSYGTTNATEMIAELSNPVFRAKLKAKKLLNKVFTAVKQIFGITPNSAYDGVNAAFDFLLANPNIELKSKELVGLSQSEKYQKFSLKRSSEFQKNITALERENESLKSQVERLKTEIRSDIKITQVDANKIADRLIADYAVNDMTKKDIVKSIMDMYNKYAVTKDGEKAYEIFKADCETLAEKIIESAGIIDNSLYEQYGELRDYLKGKEFILSKQDASNISDFTSWKKEHGLNKAKIGEKSNVDSIYQDLMDTYPEFFSDENLSPADALIEIAGVMDEISDRSITNPFKGEEELVKGYLANDIMGSLIGATSSTYAGRMEALLKDNKRRTRELISQIKSNNDAKVQALQDKYKAKTKEGKEKQNARELRNRIIKHSKALSDKLLKPTDKKHIPEDLRVATASLLAAINTASNDNKATKRTAAAQRLRLAYNDIKEEGSLTIDPDMMDNISAIEKMGDTPIGQLSMDQLETIWRVIRSTEAAITSANRVLADSKYATVQEFAEALRKDNWDKADVDIKNALGKLIRLDSLTPQAFFHRFGDSGEAIFKMLRNSQDNYIRLIDEMQRKTTSITKNADIGKLESEMHTFTFDGGEITLSTAQIMGLYELAKREQAQEHIYTGGIKPGYVKGQKNKSTPLRLSPGNIAKITSVLTDDQIKMADKLQQFMATVGADYGNQASMLVYGYKKFGEKFYYPIKVDPNQTVNDIPNSERVMGTIASMGSAKALTPHANNAVIIDSIFDVVADNSNDMAKYSSWLATMETINKVRNYKFSDGNRTKAIIEKVTGTNGNSYFFNLINDINTSKASDRALSERLVGSYKASAVGANLRVVVQQPTAGFRALALIDPKYLAKGIIHKGDWEKVKKYAPIAVWKDWGYFDINTGRSMKNVLFDSDSKIDKLNNFLMQGASLADSVTWARLWNACEYEVVDKTNLEKGSDEFYQAVAERFNEIIDKTQVVDGVLQRSGIMRSTNSINKFATSFMAEPTKTLNMVMSAAYDYKNAKTTTNKTAAKRMVLRTSLALTSSFIANALVQSVVDAIRDDDKDQDYWQKLLEAFLGINGDDTSIASVFTSNFVQNYDLFGYIPYLKDIESIIQGYSVSRMDMDAIESVVKSAKYLISAFGGEGKRTLASALADFLAETSRLVGLPVANIKKDAIGIIRTVLSGISDPYAQYRFEKFFYNMDSSSGRTIFYDILYNAYKSDKDAYSQIRQDMIKNGVKSDSIDSAIKNRKKKEK